MATPEDRTFFVDTNVLLAACDAGRNKHLPCLSIIEDGLIGKRSLFADGQIFREFLVVATRPTNVNGLGMNPADAVANLTEFSRCIRLLEETDSVSRHLRRIVLQHNLRGKRIHDANLFATMQEHGLTQLITDNPNDFKEFPDLKIIVP